jgi:type I restriction enzyme S subunit
VLRLAKFVNGYPFKPDDLGVAGPPVVRIRQLLDPSAESDTAAVPDRPVFVDDGDLVFSWSATLAARLWHRERALLNQHLFRVDPRPGVDRRWLRYVLDEAARRLEPLMHGSAMTHITIDMLRQVTVELPSTAEQRAIVDYLDRETTRIDALIEKKQRLVDRLVERSAAAIERLIWLRHGDSVAVDRLKHIATRIDVGIAEAATHAFVDAGVPLLRSTNIRANAVDATDLLYIEPWFADRNASKYIRAGDIVTVRTGNVGVSAVVPSSLDRCQCFTQLITTIDALNNSRFVCYALNSGPAHGHFQTSGWGSAQANISVPILANVPVPIVERHEQERILAQINELTAPAGKTLEALRRQLVLLVEKRRALIIAVVTGQFPIPGAA